MSYLPESSAPRFSRAAYYIQSARHARGAKWAHETSDEQFARMNQYVEKAVADIKEGYVLAPCSFLAYYLTMRATQAYGATEASRQYLDEALAVYPYSFLLRSMHLYNLVPRWGGSYAAMEQFAREADGLWDRNPRLKSLHGFAHWDRGRVYWRDRDTTSAILEPAKALVFGDLWQFRLELGKLNYRLDQFKKALSNLDRAVAQRPVSVEALRFRAQTHYALGRMANGAEEARLFSAAFRDIELAARLDPTDERVRNDREFYQKWIPEFAPQAVR